MRITMLWTFTLGKVQKKLEKIKEIGRQVKNLRNLGFLAAPAGIFHFGVNKSISQHLEKILGKGIEQEKRVTSRLFPHILIKAAPTPYLPQVPPRSSKSLLDIGQRSTQLCLHGEIHLQQSRKSDFSAAQSPVSPICEGVDRAKAAAATGR